MTSSRSFVAMSMSMSGMVLLSSVRKRSKRRSCAIGSTLVMSRTYATVESAAGAVRRDPPLRAGPDDVPVDQEELSELRALDDVELVPQLLADPGSDAPVLLARALLAELVEVREGRVPLP